MQALCTNRVHNLAWEEDAAPAHLWRARRVLCCTHRLRQVVMSDNHDLCRHAIAVTDVTAPFQDWTTPLLSDRYDSHLCQVGKNAVC